MRFRTGIALTGIAMVLYAGAAQAQGLFVSGVGAVNRSFGSAAVAAPLDAAGAVYWNPATMSGLPSSETEFGLELLWADTKVSSDVAAFGLSGSTDDDSGVNPIPAFAIVQKNPESDFTFGLGFFGVAGFRVDYPTDPANPILAPQQVGGLGRVVGSADYFQLVPAVSYALTPCTSIGLSPVLTIGKVEATPFVFTEPNANGTYPPGMDPNYRYGGGFEVGVYHQTGEGVNLGAAFKSTQWMESNTINTTDENGLPRRESFDLDLPSIISLGSSYTGIKQWVFAVDVRYFDYANAAGFKGEGFDSRGAVKGLGWDSIFSVSPGVQYSPTDKTSIRVGYTYNEQPIDGGNAMFNVASPLVTQHVLGVGFSYEIVRDTLLSLTYLHGFENSVSGPMVRPGLGDLPGTSVEDSTSAEAIAMALTFRR